MNDFEALEKALIEGSLNHNSISSAYRSWIRKRKDIPEGVKSILSMAGGGDLLGMMFRLMSQTIGRMELAYRRGYQAGYGDKQTKEAERSKT